MNQITSDAYRRAFVRYLRTGAPIRLERKDSGLYIWRTRRDGKVRLAHQMREGHLYRRGDPDVPPPGHDFNCRCVAVPYVQGETEFAAIDLMIERDTERRWNWIDFFRHFAFGGGKTVDLAETGQRAEIAYTHAYRPTSAADNRTIGVGTFARLPGQIAAEARKAKDGKIDYSFPGRSYDFTRVSRAHGRANVRGQVQGSVVDHGNWIAVQGVVSFTFEDEFTDVLDIRQVLNIREVEAALWSDMGGAGYKITGTWKAEFRAEYLKDDSKSIYKENGR